MGPAEVRKHCALDESGRSLVRAAMQQLQMSARAFHRILKLARTISDLEGAGDIQTHHLAEAIQFPFPLFRRRRDIDVGSTAGPKAKTTDLQENADLLAFPSASSCVSVVVAGLQEREALYWVAARAPKIMWGAPMSSSVCRMSRNRLRSGGRSFAHDGGHHANIGSRLLKMGALFNVMKPEWVAEK